MIQCSSTSVFEIFPFGNVEVVGADTREQLRQHLKRFRSVLVDRGARRQLARELKVPRPDLERAIHQLVWIGIARIDGDVLHLRGGR